MPRCRRADSDRAPSAYACTSALRSGELTSGARYWSIASSVGILGIGERLAAQTVLAARQRLVRDPRREPRFCKLAFADSIEDRLQRGRRAVGLDVAVRQQHRANALRIAQDEQLRDGTAAVVRDEVDCRDRKRVEQRREHLDLRIRRATLPRRDLRESEAEEIRRHTATIVGEPVERAAPLKAAEREAVQEQRGRSAPALNVRDLSESQRREASRGTPGRRIRCFDRVCSNRKRSRRSRPPRFRLLPLP